jgi:type I restriction enzyme S subunit
MGLQLQKYSGYQQTDLPWLDEVPAHWCLIRKKYLFEERVQKGYPDEPLLAATQAQGVVRKAEYESRTVEATKDFHLMKLVREGDFVISLRSFEGGIEYAHHQGIISPAYTVLIPRDISEARYYRHLLKSRPFIQGLRLFVTGIREGQNIDYTKLSRTFLPCPPVDECNRIANFLDQKTAEIDEAIAKKQRLIELLKEQKTVLINQAVTKGLNPDVPMRDSGAAWVGEVPEDWVVKRAKFLFYEIDERSQTGAEELLSVSHMTGVTPRSEKNIYMFMAEDYSGSKVCREGDLVFNIMWAWMGALGVSDRAGIVSPSYGVYRQRYKGAFNSWFLENLLHSGQYVAEYNRRSTGLHSSRLRLYPDMFFDMEIGFPAKLEQDRIEQAIKEKTADIDNAVSAVNAEIEALSEYRQVVIAEVVTGKIKL